MSIDNTKVVNLNLKKEDRVLDFSDFQKQNLKFDINKLQEAYNQRFRHSEKIRGIFFLRSNQEKLSIKKLIEFNRSINTATGYGASRLQDVELPARR